MNIIPQPNISNSMVSSTEQQNSLFKYTQAIAPALFLGISTLKFLLFSVLLLVAFISWLWTISFQTGWLFGKWIEINKPDAIQTAYKLGEIILFPFVYLAAWSQKQVKQYWQIEFPSLSESEPPQKCTELSLFKKLVENQ